MGTAAQRLGSVPGSLGECAETEKKEGETSTTHSAVLMRCVFGDRPQALPVLPDRLPITGVTGKRVSKFVLGVAAVATDPVKGDLVKL